MKILAFVVGIILLPVCFAMTETAVALVHAVTPSSVAGIPPSAWALGGGFILWIIIYFTIPLPVRTYVLAHELTHALWGAMMGAKIFRMKISKQSGSVTMSKSNFLITLAPYFFPLYTVLIIAGYYILSIFHDVGAYYLFWLGLVGFTWGFHFTFTISTLMQHQNDIREYGAVFSYAFIYLLNIAGICVWVVVVSEATMDQFVRYAIAATREICVALWNHGVRAFEEIRKSIQ